MDSDYTKDFELGIDINKAFQPVSTSDTTWRFWVARIGTFYEMEDNPYNMVKDRFSRRVEGISLPDWRFRFQTWMKEKHQGSPTFNE